MPSVWTDGEDSTSQGLHAFTLCRGLGYWRRGWGSSGVTAARERSNWLAATKSVDSHKKAWITRGGGGGGWLK